MKIPLSMRNSLEPGQTWCLHFKWPLYKKLKTKNRNPTYRLQRIKCYPLENKIMKKKPTH